MSAERESDAEFVEYWVNARKINCYTSDPQIFYRLLDLAQEAFPRRATAPAPQRQDHDPLTFSYRNHRGEVAERRVHPISVRWGSTEWHPEPQWLMLAFDVDKGAEREFALRDMGASQQQDGYRAGLMRAAEIIESRAADHRKEAAAYKQQGVDAPGWMTIALALDRITVPIRAEAAAPEPPVVIDGTPSSGGAGDDAEFVETARRVVARMRVTHDSYAGFEMVTIRKSAAERLIALAALYAAPPAPVPAGEVTEKLHFKSGEHLWHHAKMTGMCGFINDLCEDWCEMHAALTAAQPRADAGVTEAMVATLKAELKRQGEDDVSWTACYSALRAALAAREVRG